MYDDDDDDDLDYDDGDSGRIVGRDVVLQPPPDAARMPQVDRVVASLSLVFQQAGEQPVPLDVRYCAALDTAGQEYSDRQVYQRHLLVTPTPTPLDVGWVKDPGTVVLHNRGPGDYPVQPTKEEQERHAGLVVLTHWWEPASTGPQCSPGRFVVFEVPPDVPLKLSCPTGPCRVSVWVLPR